MNTESEGEGSWFFDQFPASSHDVLTAPVKTFTAEVPVSTTKTLTHSPEAEPCTSPTIALWNAPTTLDAFAVVDVGVPPPWVVSTRPSSVVLSTRMFVPPAVNSRNVTEL